MRSPLLLAVALALPAGCSQVATAADAALAREIHGHVGAHEVVRGREEVRIFWSFRGSRPVITVYGLTDPDERAALVGELREQGSARDWPRFDVRFFEAENIEVVGSGKLQARRRDGEVLLEEARLP